MDSINIIPYIWSDPIPTNTGHKSNDLTKPKTLRNRCNNPNHPPRKYVGQITNLEFVNNLSGQSHQLQSSLSEPTLPNLGPGDIEVTVVTSMEYDTTAEEIVNNKTVRVDKEGQLSKTPDNHKICRGCSAVGHILESCPKDHGLKFTDCQMYQIGQANASARKTKPTGTGIGQLSVCFQNLANSPPASSTSPAPRGPAHGCCKNNNTTIPSPDTATQQMVKKTTEPA